MEGEGEGGAGEGGAGGRRGDVCARACVGVCARVCARACACVRACVRHARLRAHAWACACGRAARPCGRVRVRTTAAHRQRRFPRARIRVCAGACARARAGACGRVHCHGHPPPAAPPPRLRRLRPSARRIPARAGPGGPGGPGGGGGGGVEDEGDEVRQGRPAQAARHLYVRARTHAWVGARALLHSSNGVVAPLNTRRVAVMYCSRPILGESQSIQDRVEVQNLRSRR